MTLDLGVPLRTLHATDEQYATAPEEYPTQDQVIRCVLPTAIAVTAPMSAAEALVPNGTINIKVHMKIIILKIVFTISLSFFGLLIDKGLAVKILIRALDSNMIASIAGARAGRCCINQAARVHRPSLH